MGLIARSGWEHADAASSLRRSAQTGAESKERTNGFDRAPAALKERDVAARGQGNAQSIAEAEIQQMLQAMIKQRREAIALYDQGKRPDLAQRERDEIAVIESFLPRQFDEVEIEEAATAIIAETGASGVKDIGKVMAALRANYAGVIDFSRAAAIVRRLLG